MQVNNCEKLIDLFHKAIRTTEESAKVDFSELNRKAVVLGYVIHPDCCNRMVEKWLDSLTANHNATFYKEWTDVISKDRFELFIDQISHYATTYGTGFSSGNGYVPNDGSVPPSFKKLKVIEAISMEDMYKRCLDLVSKGIALKTATMEAVCDFIAKVHKTFDAPFDIDAVACKEAQAYLCFKLGMYPRDEFGMLRCLVYRYAKTTMLIKNRETFRAIRLYAGLLKEKSPLNSLSRDQKIALSRIFLRYKPIFLAMKTKHTACAINEISRMAKTNHRPMKLGFWDTLISDPHPISTVEEMLGSAKPDIFRRIRLLQATRIALNSEMKDGFYMVRNGKGFLRKDYSPKYDRTYLTMLETVLERSVVEDLAKKSCKVRLPKHFELAVPTSEKSFVGNLPFGTEISLTSHTVVGIYWRNEWGARDIDISMTDCHGGRIGWDAFYYADDGKDIPDIVYSGDMTNADPEASELLYMAKTIPNGVVKANLYNGNPNSRFRFFVATEEIDLRNCMNHMVDPNNVRLDTTVEFEPGKREQVIATIRNGKLVLTNFSTGNRIVSRGNDIAIRTIEAVGEKTRFIPKLRELLLKAGFTIVDGEDDEGIDLFDPTKDDILNLLKD